LSLRLYTSGTTGRPKGVPRRHRAERAAALAHVAQNLYGRDETRRGAGRGSGHFPAGVPGLLPFKSTK
jgi:non-ribosomal peptide synthetase component F